MKKSNKISIEKINGKWLWIFWDDKTENQCHGIRYCQYCGKYLDE